MKLKAQFRILSRNGKILLHYAKISAFMSLKLTMVYVIQLRFAQTLICLYLYYRRYFVAIWFTPSLSFVGYLFLVISLHWLLISKNRLVHYPKENRNTFIHSNKETWLLIKPTQLVVIPWKSQVPTQCIIISCEKRLCNADLNFTW